METEVSGLRELGEALQAFGPTLARKYLAKAVYTAADVIRDDAFSRAPFRTGNLRAHIAIFRRQATDNVAEYDVGVRPIRLNAKVKKVLRILRRSTGRRTAIQGDPYYWRFLEFGTSRMAARPFLRPAFEAQKGKALDKFRESLAVGVEKAAAEVNRNG
jgi:HK97 gp10 family phage protein